MLLRPKVCRCAADGRYPSPPGDDPGRLSHPCPQDLRKPGLADVLPARIVGRCEDCIHRPPRRIGMARSYRGDRPMHGAPPPPRRLELATAAGPRQHDAGPPTDLRRGS